MTIQNQFALSKSVTTSDEPQTINHIISLERYELMRLPHAAHSLRVVRGTAWVTVEGQDIVLNEGEEMLVMPSQDFALVSSAGQGCVVLALAG